MTHIDVYRVLQLFNVTDPCIAHAVKKLLVAGARGDKAIVSTLERDVKEAIDSLQRWQEMRREDTIDAPLFDTIPVGEVTVSALDPLPADGSGC
jgi:hypothetical protein